MPELRPRARLHLALLDVPGYTPRRFGGGGVAIDLPVGRVQASRLSTQHRSTFTFHGDIDEDTKSAVRSLAGDLRVVDGTHIDVSLELPQHHGFGTKTALLLATGALLNDLSTDPVGQESLVRSTGRGGVSGVGIQTFWSGGCVVDAGRPRNQATIAPSRYQNPEQPSLVTGVHRVADDLRVSVLLPEGQIRHGDDERRFFEKNSDLTRDEVYESIAWFHQGVVPSLIVGDVPTLRTALHRLHQIGFKRRELEGQSSSVNTLLSRLWDDERVAAGMSSMGPAVYAIHAVDTIVEWPSPASGESWTFMGTYGLPSGPTPSLAALRGST